MICGWNVKVVTPPTSVIPSSSVSQACSTGPGGWIARCPVKRKNGASSRTQATGISTSRRPSCGGCRYGRSRSIMLEEYSKPCRARSGSVWADSCQAGAR